MYKNCTLFHEADFGLIGGQIKATRKYRLIRLQHHLRYFKAWHLEKCALNGKKV